MNKDNAHHYLPLVQALAKGRQLQMVNSRGVWLDIDEVPFSWPAKEFRIKPTPRKAWVWWPPVDSLKAANGPYICLDRCHADELVQIDGGTIREISDE